MYKTPVIFATPGNIGDRIMEDLDLKWTIREQILPKYDPILRAFETLEFRYVSLSKCAQSEMDELISEIIRDWPDSAHLYYTSFSSFCFYHYAASSSWFYWADVDGHRNDKLIYDPKGQTVSIGYFLDAMRNFGISLHTMHMDFDGPFDDEISIRPGYKKNIEEIANLPRTQYELGNVELADAASWLKKLAQAKDLSAGLREKGFESAYMSIMPNGQQALLAVRYAGLIEGDSPLLLYRPNNTSDAVLNICQRVLISPTAVAGENATMVIVYMPDINKPARRKLAEFKMPYTQAQEIADWLQEWRKSK